MPIRFVDRSQTIVGHAAVSLADVSPNFDGSFTAAPGRTGAVVGQLENHAAAISGIFQVNANRVGTVASTLSNATSSMIGSAPGAPNPNEITALAVTSVAGGTQPFFFGQEFKEGDVASGQGVVTDTAGVTLRVYPLARWPTDNSLRHAAVFGSAGFSAGVAKSISFKTGTPAGGTNLTASNIASAIAAAGTTSQQCGSIGTVNLASLTGSPFRTRISTPEMVECHYRSQVGSDADLVVWWHVRLFAGGKLWVQPYVENGYLNGSPTARTYVWTVIIGGTTVHSASRTHDKWGRMVQVGWIGTDPQVTPSHNVAYLRDSMMAPCYGFTSPSGTALNDADVSYTPMSYDPLRKVTTGTGYHPSIGHHPLWDTMYFTSGDVRPFRGMVSAAKAAGAYALARRNSSTNRHPKISDFGTSTWFGGAGSGEAGNDNTTWDVSHAPHTGYGAYLVTADYYHYETMLNSAQAWYFCRDSSGGNGTSRNLRGFQNRAIGWGLYQIGCLCAIGHTENADAADLAVLTDMKTWLGNVYANFELYIDIVGQTKLGLTFMYTTGAWNGAGSVAPWMTNWWVGTNGRLRDLKPIANLASINRVAYFMYRWSIGALGPTGVANYYFAYAAEYGFIVDPTGDTGAIETNFYDSWGDVFTATQGHANNETTNTLQGGSGSAPSGAATGYWGNLRPGIYQAVDHGAPGALAAVRRMEGASNYSAVTGSGFHDIPIFGMSARTRSTALAVAAATLGAGQCRFFGTIPSAVYGPDAPASGGMAMYGAQGVYDPIRREVRYVGKRDSAGYPYHFLVYTEATDAWSINTPVWSGGQANQNGHGYDHNCHDPLTGFHYHRPYNDDVIQRWNGSSWTALTVMNSPAPQIAGSIRWHPKIGNNGALVYSDQRTIRKLVGTTWTTIASFGSVPNAYHTVSCYNWISDCFIFGAGNASDDFRQMSSTEVITTVPTPGYNFGSSENFGLITHDPLGPGFIGWKKTSKNWQFWKPGDGAWTNLTQSSGSGASPQSGLPNLDDAATGRHAIVIPIDAYGILMFVQNTGSGANVWIYRHS